MPLFKKKVPYDQLRPYVVSELHKEESCSRGSDSADDKEDTNSDDSLSDDSINDSSKLHKGNVYFHLLQIVDLLQILV